ncbi:hypothetical protein GCM10007094_11230 [Pseudovibrio japonicus]|uniref:DUF1150 domain-containing protein n=1 Tax=Pseudovibrio japonicus TaxID=366534 RepID=A0ABQ3E4U8_9HYPH|nr:DUF1150 domain-containing protein [Pseudovibrio japonicus]GHB24922.1 hypothetical protein GCM10007094_11230 [Pseudovibrio japonicus]
MTHAPSVLADDPYENFEELGAGEVAYVRRISPKDLKKMFPDAELQDADLPAWALLAADGTPLVLTDTRNAAIANAIENDLEALSVH